MTTTLIAVAVRPDGTVSPHAGRALLWRVYAVSTLTDGEASPVPAWDIHLTQSGCLHEWHVRPDNGRHPLHTVDIAIAGSAGDGVHKRLADRNTTLVATSEPDPLKAVLDYMSGTLAPALPHDERECLHPGDDHDGIPVGGV